jgi:hypothetical protein
VLESYCQRRGQPEKWPELQQAREQAMASAAGSGKPDDDWKAAKGGIYNAARSLLGLRGAGSTADVFLAEQLAPVLAPGMTVYEELRRDVFRSPDP